MRVVGTLSNENSARRLAGFLKSQGIDNSCEVSFEPQTGHMTYQVWVHDEDRISDAASIFERFQKNPSGSEFDAPALESMPEQMPGQMPGQIQEPTQEQEESIPSSGPRQNSRAQEPVTHQFPTHLTSFFIFLCALLFFINTMEEVPLREEGLSEKTFMMTPIQALFLYDLPPAIEQLEKVIEKHRVAPNQKLEELPPEVKAELEAVDRVPFWRGFYEWMVLKIKKQDTSLAEGPLFVRIREGEIWRLFSPCILHQNLLHILFNMIWLWVLGRSIEQRIGFFRTLLLTLIAGIGSNTVQYLMTGPLFLGYSGVVMGLAGFIWMREKVAPWEGYPLNRATVLFLLLFIGAIFALQMVSFFIQIFSNLNFAPNIANSAHIAGAVIGALLGKLSYFAQRVKK